MDKQQLQDKLQRVLDYSVEKEQAVGANLLIIQDGEEMAYVQSGYANRENKRPYDRDTIMRMYSMSKPITAVAVMILVERGVISLGEPVWKYLPGFRNQTIIESDKTKRPVNRPAYIKDLMSMTSGLPYGYDLGSPVEKKVQKFFDKIDEKLYTKKAYTTVDIANELGKIGVCFQPGDTWMYGTSADVLGAIVEVVSGMKYGDFLKKELFEPLEMVDTGFFVPEEKRDRMAEPYERINGTLKHFPTNHLGIKYTQESEPAFQSGGAGVISTIDDYSHFAQMLMNGGIYKDKRILSEATVNYMTHGKLMPWQQEKLWHDWDGHAGYSYGCLMQHMIEPQMSYYMTYMDEYGWDGWLGTYFCNSPKNKLTILMGVQVSNPEGNLIFEKVRNTIGQFFD